jgi:putative salt-induced outer membrane protein YdiY
MKALSTARRGALTAVSFCAVLGVHGRALAQQAPTGAPPPDAKAVVEAPKEGEAPKIAKKVDGTTISVSAGGLLTTGNSRLVALSGNGVYETRWNDNGFGASLMGNYGQGAPGGGEVHVTTENVQGRLRYDRYVVDEFALFLINTGRHDRFQGLDFRYNLDPGAKYLFIPEATRALWVELGYDFQYDVRRDGDRTVLDANKNPVLDANGQPQLLDKTATDHSIRAFVGHKHGFNKEVTLALGLEYLQSVVDVDRYRINADALLAAKIGGGLAVGVGFSARFDHQPLPGKEKLDTSTALSLIYAFTDAPEDEKKTCPCPEPPPPPPEPAAPEPAAAPAPTPDTPPPAPSSSDSP